MPWIAHPRVDRLYDPHTASYWCETEKNRDFHQKWVKHAKLKYANHPVYVTPCRVRLFRYGIELPVEEMQGLMPIAWLDNTICYMLAHALLEWEREGDIAEVRLFGIHMRGTGEYVHERPAVCYIIGFMQGRGMTVDAVPGSPLLMSAWTQGRYGLSTERRKHDLNPSVGVLEVKNKEDDPMAKPSNPQFDGKVEFFEASDGTVKVRFKSADPTFVPVFGADELTERTDKNGRQLTYREAYAASWAQFTNPPQAPKRGRKKKGK